MMTPFLSQEDIRDMFRVRIEMMMNNGLQIVVPKFIMPQFEFDPLTINDFYGVDWCKRKANISKLRSIIRKAKQKA